MFGNTDEKTYRHYSQLRRAVVISVLLVVAGLTGSMAYGATQAAGPKPSAPRVNVWCVGETSGVRTGAPCNNGPNAYTSINFAISVAGAGDEIRIMGGSYYENVSVDKPVTLYGGFSGDPQAWGNPQAGCINDPGCTRINGAFSVVSAFEVIVNGLTFKGNIGNTNGGTITAYGAGIRLENTGGTTVINGRWNIAAPAFLEILDGTEIAQAGTQVVGDGWLYVYTGGVLSVSDNLTVPRLALQYRTTAPGYVDGPGTLNISNQLIWEAGEMRGTGVTNLMPGATMDVTHTSFGAPGYIAQRTFNNQGTVNWDSNYALTLNNGGTFNNTGLFTLQENTNLPIFTDSSFGTFNNSGILRSPGTVYRQVLKPDANVVFNNTGNIDIPDAGGTLHFLQGTFNLQNGSTLTGAGVAQVGDQSGVWNVTGTVNARNVTVISANNCSACNGVAGTGMLNISGNLEWASGTMFGSGVTNLLAGATARISGSATLDTRTFNNQGTVNFMDNSRLYISGAAVLNNNGTANTGNSAELWSNSGQTGTFNNMGTFNKLPNHEFIVWQGATLLNSNGGTINITPPVGLGMNGGQFRQAGGVTNINSETNLWSNDLPLILEGGIVRGTGNLDGNVNNTGAEISPGAAPSTAGSMTVNGNYTQASGGRLSIDIGGTTPGTEYDRLVVNGIASLAGTLNVATINGYSPPSGSGFTVMTYNSHSGTFGTIAGPFSAAYNPTDVTLTSTPGTCTQGVFIDVPEGSTFYPYVTCLVNRGVISGYSDCTFRPGNNLTRGQVSKIVSNSANFTDDVNGRQTYTDVPADNPFWLWIERLSLHGAMGGYACGGPNEPCDAQQRPYFRPTADITRGQLSKITSNAAGFSDTPTGQTFEDVPTSNTFWLFIERLSLHGAIGGYDCGGVGEPCNPPGNRPYFRPGNNVTRGQASKIIAKAFFPSCTTR